MSMPENIYAIHAVFLAKENILFMEEWIDYHLQLGFSKFYLYDNSKCVKPGAFDSNKEYMELGKVNKHNINYDEIVNLDQQQIEGLLSSLEKRYKDNLILIEWTPTDKDGYVTYGQVEAHNDCLHRLKKDRVAWCANIDMDEFIVLEKYGTIHSYIDTLDNEISNIKMDQTHFETRFKYPDNLVIDMQKGFYRDFGAEKCIYKVEKTSRMEVHRWHGEGEELYVKQGSISFNHYVHSDNHEPHELEVIDNINVRIKEVIKQHSIRYLREFPAAILRQIDALPLKARTAGGRRILHYVPCFSKPTETFIYDLVCRLDEQTDHDNIVLFRQFAMRDERPYGKKVFMPWQWMPPEVGQTLWEYLLAQCEIDVLIVHFAGHIHHLHQLAAPTGLEPPTLVMTHGYDVFDLKTPNDPSRYITDQLARRDDVLFTAPSGYLAGEAEAAGIPADKVRVLPNAAHERFFLHRKTDGFYDGRRTLRLLNVGRLIRLKGHHLLLDALARFRQECTEDVQLTIVYGHRGDCLDALHEQAASLGLADCVVFEPFVDFAADPGYHSRFDLYLHCSTYDEEDERKSESFGIAALEAIAAGLPTISTDAGGTPEVVGRDTAHSRIVRHGDADALFRALADMYGTQEAFTDNFNYASDRLAAFSIQRQLTDMEGLIQWLMP